MNGDGAAAEMRVLHILNSTKGGATLGALEYVKASVRSGEGLVHYAVYPGPPGMPDPAIHSVFEDAQAIPLPAWNRPRNLGFGSRMLLATLVARHTAFGIRTMRCLAEAIRQWRIDLVTTNCAANIHGAFAARRAGLPHVWHIRERIGTGGSMRFSLDDRRLVQRIAELSTVIAAVSECVAEPFRKHGTGDRLEVVYDLVDEAAFSSPDAVERGRDLRQAWGIPEHVVLIGMVANVIPIKAHDVFVRAAGIVAREHPEVRFVAVGAIPGQSRWFGRTEETWWKDLQQLTHDQGLDGRFVWAGAIDDPPAIMNAIDIMAHACPVEGFPRVVIEAMAAGRPVVVPASGGAAEAAQDDITGILVQPSSARELATGIRTLVADSTLRRRMGAAGRARVESLFTLDRHLDTMLSLYHGCAGQAVVDPVKPVPSKVAGTLC